MKKYYNKILIAFLILILCLPYANSDNGIYYGPSYYYSDSGSAKTVGYLNNSRFIVAFSNNSNGNKGTCRLGIITDGTEINYYGASYIFNNAVTGNIEIAILNETKFVICYRDNQDYHGRCVVGNVSDDVINLGSEYEFYDAGDVGTPKITTLNSSTVIVLPSNGKYCKIGNINGLIISFTSEYIFETEGILSPSLDSFNETKFIISYKETSTGYGSCKIGNITNNQIGYGSKYTFSSNLIQSPSVTTLNETSFIVFYENYYSKTGCCKLGNLSGSYGDEINYNDEYIFINIGIHLQFFESIKLNLTTVVVSYQTIYITTYTCKSNIIKILNNDISSSSSYIWSGSRNDYFRMSRINDTYYILSYEDYCLIAVNDVLPEFSNNYVSPNVGYETITNFVFNVTIKDSDSIFNNVYLNISLGASFINQSMTYVTGDNSTGANYTSNSTISVSGTLTYIISVYDGYFWNSTVGTFTVLNNISFEINFPVYLNVGDTILSYGTLTNTTDSPINNIWAYTKILTSDWSVVTFSNMRFYIVNGLYQYVFSTSTMVPGIYYININYSYAGLDYFSNRTLYLSYPGGPGHILTNVHFTYYNDNTGVGIDPISFKLYVDDEIPLTAIDRIYQDTFYNAYTGQTIYYKVLDYFDNKIYPLDADQSSVLIESPNQFIDIPIDWNSFSVKNMNHSIVKFTLTNGSRSITQYLFPYEPFYYNLLDGIYAVAMQYYNANTGAYEETQYTNITITEDTYYWIIGYDLNDIIIEITNTNTSILDQIINIGVNINNDGVDIINQTVNLAYWLSNHETNITNQLNLIWADVNNTETTIISQNNLIKQDIINSQVNITNQVNYVWQSINTTNSTITNQANLIRQDVINHNTNITQQINGMWQSVNNTNSSIGTQINTVNQNVGNLNSNVTTQVNYMRQDIHNTETNITVQLNNVWQSVNTSNSTIITQINSVSQQVTTFESNITTQINSVSQQVINFESNITTQINAVTLSITNSETNITNQITLVNTSINNANTSIHTQINSVSTQITNTETNITNQLNNVQVQIINTETNITNQLNNVNISIQNSNTSIHNQLNAIISQITNSNSTIITQTNLILNQITTTESNITTQINAINNNIENSENNITAQINIIANNLVNTESNITTQLNAIHTSINNSNVTTQYNIITTTITNTESNLTNQINSVKTDITSTESNITTQINAINTAIVNNKTNMIDQINLVWNSINTTNSSIITQVNGVSTSITTMWSNVNYSFSVITSNIYNTENNITNLITDMNASLYAKLIGILDNVSEAGENVFDKAIYILENISNINLSLFNEIQDQALLVMVNVTEQADINLDILNNLSNALGLITGDTIANALVNITNDINTILSDVGNITMNITANLTVNLSSVLENLSLIMDDLDMTNVTIGDLINVTIGDLNNVTVRMWESQNTSFGILQNRSAIVFSFYNTNEGLGLDREILKILINGSRLIDNIYYCDNGTVFNLTIKDYYNFTLYTNNFTVDAPFTFIDLGLTFHSYKFGNLNDEYYMVSFLREGATRWFERGICPFESLEFLLPSGNYTLRIYDASNVTLYNNSVVMVNSRLYVLNGSNLELVINGQSVIIGQLLELSQELDIALMPDIEIIGCNVPLMFNIMDRRGMMLGNQVIKICPSVIVQAKSRIEIDGNWINSTARIPGNDTVENGTITLLNDILYISGPWNTTWVNITYTDNGTLFQNTSYVPGKVYLAGQNITINGSNDLHIQRETEYNQQQKFYWSYTAATGHYEAGHSIINPMDVPIYDIYVFMEFANNTNPDSSTVIIRDYGNGGEILERGVNYQVSDTGINFYISNIDAGNSRRFTIEYYKEKNPDSHYYGEEQIDAGYIQKGIVLDGEYYLYCEFVWMNDNDKIFSGGLLVKFDTTKITEIDKSSVKIFDLDNGLLVDDSNYIIGDSYIRIGYDAMGDIPVGGGRSFGIYFQEIVYPGVNPEYFHLTTPIFILGGIPFTPFLLIFIICAICIVVGVIYGFVNKKNSKSVKNSLVLIGISAFIIFIFFLLQNMGI